MKLPSSFSKRLKRLRRLLTPQDQAVLPEPAKPQGSLRGTPAPELLELALQRLAPLALSALEQSLKVLWNPRMRSTAGLAYPHVNCILLNPRLREFGSGEVERTLLHELAHLVAQHRAGRRRIAPHGEEWQRACRDLGLANESRCHDLPLPRRSVARNYLYICPHCSLRIERTRPFRRAAACLPCCRKFAAGQYDARFKLSRVTPAQPGDCPPPSPSPSAPA
ncbi:MAG: hypothetical protein RLZZ142_1990 [Verrucomicrobiota bacterium]|jgi:predicted SprT family Zn-dependent metalloprotease